MFMAAEKFMAEHLGGRYQEGGTPEAVARLKEITVDPATVKLAPKVDVSAAGVPKPASSLNAGVWKYNATISIGKNTMKYSVTTSIADAPEGWSVRDAIAMPSGEVTENTVLDKTSLILLKRSVHQGPVAIDLEFKDNKASGSMNMAGQSHTVDTELGGPLFADAAGGPFVIAALPLAEGYTTQFRNLDVQKMQVKVMQLEVTGSENVTVPAGSFDSWKVVVKPTDGSAGVMTFWISKTSPKPVKYAASMPQMNGATMTAELVP
jgi:hypothetical protein